MFGMLLLPLFLAVIIFFVSSIDDASSSTRLYVMKFHGQLPLNFAEFHMMVVRTHWEAPLNMGRSVSTMGFQRRVSTSPTSEVSKSLPWAYKSNPVFTQHDAF